MQAHDFERDAGRCFLAGPISGRPVCPALLRPCVSLCTSDADCTMNVNLLRQKVIAIRLKCYLICRSKNTDITRSGQVGGRLMSVLSVHYNSRRINKQIPSNSRDQNPDIPQAAGGAAANSGAVGPDWTQTVLFARSQQFLVHSKSSKETALNDSSQAKGKKTQCESIKEQNFCLTCG